MLAFDAASRSEMPLVLSAKGKGHVVYPSATDGSEESDSEPPFVLAWHSRPYAQPFLIEELMTDSLLAPQHVKVDRIMRGLSRVVALLAALDAAELLHDEELESTHLRS